MSNFGTIAMRRIATLLLLAVAAVACVPYAPAQAAEEVNLYSFRQPDVIGPALETFTHQTGIAVNVLTLDKGMLERLRAEGENSPADVILAADIARLEGLKQAGLTQAAADPGLEGVVPAVFRDPG
eukprot:gene54892-75202_t